jgi:hypothetical protein
MSPSSESKLVAVGSSEISENFYRAELRHIPRDGNPGNPRSYRCNNLKLSTCTTSLSSAPINGLN